MGPLALAVGDGGELFAIVSNLGGARGVTRYLAGASAGEEELINRIGGEGEGRLTWASGIALDSARNVFVTDAWTDRVSVFTPEGEFVRSFGASGSGEGEFRRPSGIAIDADDEILVVDTVNHRVQRLSADGRFIAQWGRRGDGEGELDSPWGICVDADGFIYVADHKNHRIQKFAADGEFVFALGGYGDGDSQFDHPSDVAVDPAGDIYVCDWANHRVQAYDAEGGYITTFIGDAQELSKWQREYVRSNPTCTKRGGASIRWSRSGASPCRRRWRSTPPTPACWSPTPSAGASKYTTRRWITASRSSTFSARGKIAKIPYPVASDRNETE